MSCYCELCGAEGDQTIRLRESNLMLCAYCAEPREPFPALEAFYLSAANTDSPLVKLELAKNAARYAFNQVMRAGKISVDEKGAVNDQGAIERQFSPDALNDLYSVVAGKYPFGPGLHTYPEGDGNCSRIFEACLQLERQGRIKRVPESSDSLHVLWIPTELD